MCRTRDWGCGRIAGGLGIEACAGYFFTLFTIEFATFVPQTRYFPSSSSMGSKKAMPGESLRKRA